MTTDQLGPATGFWAPLIQTVAAIRMRLPMRRRIHVSELSPHLLKDIGLDTFDPLDRDKLR